MAKDYTEISSKLKSTEFGVFSFSLVHDILHDARDNKDEKLIEFIEDALAYTKRTDLILRGKNDER